MIDGEALSAVAGLLWIAAGISALFTEAWPVGVGMLAIALLFVVVALTMPWWPGGPRHKQRP